MSLNTHTLCVHVLTRHSLDPDRLRKHSSESKLRYCIDKDSLLVRLVQYTRYQLAARGQERLGQKYKLLVSRQHAPIIHYTYEHHCTLLAERLLPDTDSDFARWMPDFRDQ